jgi:hypothetical protein
MPVPGADGEVDVIGLKATSGELKRLAITGIVILSEAKNL